MTTSAGERTPPVSPRVCVAVVSWNTRDLLERCLSSLAPEVESRRAEVWVVDNASSDGSPELVEASFPWARLIAGDENLGFGPAVNEVARRTRSEWLAPANADIELAPGALETLLETGDRHPEAGVVAPRLVLGNGTPQHSVYAFPTLPFTTLFNLGVQRLHRSIGERMCLEGYWDPTSPREVDWAIGAFLAVRREAWDAVGGFDPQQWMYAEDLDLGWRLARAGWKTRYEPRAEVRHHASAATTQAWGDQRTERWLESTYAWLLRRRGAARMRATALINVVGAATRAALLTPLARARPERWGPARGSFVQWAALHRQVGLATPTKRSARPDGQ